MSHRRCAYCLGANGPQGIENGPLKYAESDAERLAKAFADDPCGFEKTTWEVAADPRRTLANLNQFVRQSESPDLLVVHFSGHAILDEELYLLCNETDCDDLISSAIEISAVKKILNRSSARHNVLILDCCHAGAAHKGAFKGMQDVQDALHHAFQGTANVILSACARHERTRELDTLDGGAGFLSWALASACTTRFQEASQDGHTLSLTDILRLLPKILDEINQPLIEKERLPAPEALIYARGGDGEIWFTEPKLPGIPPSVHQEQYGRVDRLKAMIADHSGFMRDRLESFVGRLAELQEIQGRITERLATGGYITISGQAGQGKSSIIAKLIDTYYDEKEIAFHFIPFNPGPDHQISLLRNIMARLILKYDLSDLYVASESRPALREYFPKVLVEVVEKGGKEVIFIDGLDQLKEDVDGERDLSFLSNDVPQGIVFVLGTRPDDALRPLKLLKPHDEYRLPNLSRQDFDLILVHRGVRLELELADAFYRAMQENALYLDLVARELAEDETLMPAEMMKHIADDPNNLFTVSMARLKRRHTQWREVIKPILGVLLVAREPLWSLHIRQIIGTDDESLREGLERLGGLLAEDGQNRYYLFHLKLQDYLRQNVRASEKEYIFATDEEEGWHNKLAQWCEQSSILTVWQDSKHDTGEKKRREYGRQHYIAHLYFARNWRQLFKVLDTKEFGQSKIKQDPSMHSYDQDLYMGQLAAGWGGWSPEDGIELLPRLWQYTLLRCNLANRADAYSLDDFEILVMLGHEQEALGLAELLTNPAYKAKVFVLIGKEFVKVSKRMHEALQFFMRAQELAEAVGEDDKITKILGKFSDELAQAREWEPAKAVVYIIKSDRAKEEALQQLSRKLIQAQMLKQAEAVIDTIEEPLHKEECLRELGIALAQTQQWIQVKALLPALESRANRNSLLREFGIALAQARQWEQAEAIAISLERTEDRIEVLQKLAEALSDSQNWRRATAKWDEIFKLTHRINGSDKRLHILLNLGRKFIQMQLWEQAESVWDELLILAHTVDINHVRVSTLSEIFKTFIEVKQFERAELIVGIITDRKIKIGAAQLLNEVFIQAQQWERAEAIARSPVYSWDSHTMLRKLVKALAQAQQWERAEAIARSLNNVLNRDVVLREFVKALTQAQQWERAETFARSLKNESDSDAVLRELGIALAQAQQWERAGAIARSLKDAWDSDAVLCELGIALAQAQQWERAETIARSLKQTGDEGKGLLAIADESINTQQWELAKTIICKMHSKQQILVLKDYINHLAKTKRLNEVEILWIETEVIGRSTNNNQERLELLREIANALANVKEFEYLLRLTQRTWSQVESTERIIELLPMALGFISLRPHIGEAFYSAFVWVDTFLKG